MCIRDRMGAAWLCTHLWTHYEYTLDREFLERSYPIMCEAALFFIDFLVEKDGYLVTCPSLSPENTYCLPNGEMGAVSYGATMDNQILRDLFSQCLAAGKILQATNSAFLEKAEYVLQKLLPTRIGSDGRIMEWMEEYEECEPGHRHISHLYLSLIHILFYNICILTCDRNIIQIKVCITICFKK